MDASGDLGAKLLLLLVHERDDRLACRRVFTACPEQQASMCRVRLDPGPKRIEQGADGLSATVVCFQQTHECPVPRLKHGNDQPIARAEVLVERAGRNAGGRDQAINTDAPETLCVEYADGARNHLSSFIHVLECKGIVLHVNPACDHQPHLLFRAPSWRAIGSLRLFQAEVQDGIRDVLGRFALREVADSVEDLTLINTVEEAFAARGAVGVIASVGAAVQYQRGYA